VLSCGTVHRAIESGRIEKPVSFWKKLPTLHFLRKKHWQRIKEPGSQGYEPATVQKHGFGLRKGFYGTTVRNLR
jgi:hypothetical protein